jgi:PAS domain S-box-containing protein
LALIVTLAAIFLTEATLLRTGAPFLLLIVAILVSTWYGGLGPGFVAIVLATVAALDFLELPLGSFTIVDWSNVLRLGLFLLSAFIISALVADRDRARKTAESQARRQAAIAQLGERALASANARAILEQAPSLLTQILGLEFSYVLELLPNGETLRIIAGHGWKEGTVGNTTLSRNTLSQTHYTLLSQAPVIVADLRTEKRFAPPRFLLDHGIQSGMTVMILGQEKPFGILGAFSTRRRSFAEDDIHFLQAIANVLATAIQHQRAEDALWESKELLETMFSSIDLMVAYMDKELGFIRVNRAYAAADGREPEFYVGKNHFALFPHAENETIFRRVVETGQPYSVYAKPFEYAEHPERGVSHWDWTLQPVKDPNGSVTGVVLSLVNVSERVKAQEALQAAAERMRELAREMILLQEEDRRRLSHALYNDTAQIMAATMLSLQTVCADLPAETEPMRLRLHDASNHLGEAILGVRVLAGDLHPPALETLGLDRALAALCQDVAGRSSMVIDYAGADLTGLSDTHAIFLYRFVQEALSNATHHARGNRILVSLQKEASKITATVQDDGVGFDTHAALPDLRGKRGSGLAALSERLKLLGGHLEIDARPDEGTLLTAVIPFS